MIEIKESNRVPEQKGPQVNYSAIREMNANKFDMSMSIDLCTDIDTLKAFCKLLLYFINDYADIKHIRDKRINKYINIHSGTMRRPTEEEVKQIAEYHNMSIEQIQAIYN